MEPRLGRMFHSSATGRRRDQTLPEALGLRQALTHEVTPLAGDDLTRLRHFDKYLPI
jgi:hypothetical protein